MNNNYISNLNYKIIAIVFIIMGITGGFSTLSNGVELIGKFLFSLYGLAIGLILGAGFTFLINSWKSRQETKSKTLLIFIFLGIAPMFWAFFDLEEHIQSKKGLIIMLVFDTISIALLTLLFWNDKRNLIPVLLLAPVWQLISLYWFISITWKEMNYWD